MLIFNSESIHTLRDPNACFASKIFALLRKLFIFFLNYCPVDTSVSATPEKNLRNVTNVKHLSLTSSAFVGTWLASTVGRETTCATFVASASVSLTISKSTYKGMTNPKNQHVKFAETNLRTVILSCRTTSRSMVLIPSSAMSGTYLSDIVFH